MTLRALVVLAAIAAAVPAMAEDAPADAGAAASPETLTGTAAFGGYENDAPGVTRLIRPEDMPPPLATPSVRNQPDLVDRGDRVPSVPEGFEVSLFADGLERPRTIRIAPNGDVFLAESGSGRILVFRPGDGTEAPKESVFAGGHDYPYGLAFYPPGPEPKYLYVASRGNVVRYPYAVGDTEASGAAETIVPRLPTGGHATRDIAFSADGTKMYVAVGSSSNVGQDLPKLSAGDMAAGDAEAGIAGALWGREEGRADVLVFDPEGKDQRIFATGIRNCSGLGVQPATGDVWCAVNERDGLGDNLVPDYVTRVREGAFYGWPWFYIGDHEEPRQAGVRPDLADKVTVPDVLIQPHSAALAIAFYGADLFPAEYAGSAFVTLHGSWNRSLRTGYKVVRVLMENGAPTGVYEDFMTGFTVDDSSVWGRPTGVAVMADGTLLVSEDGSGTIWRVTHAAGG